MTFFYSDTAPRSASTINVWKMNGTKGYLRHYDNFLYLNFMAQHGTRVERIQAEKEMVICKRKLAFWERHPNTDRELLRVEKERMNRQWRMK